MKSIIFDNSEMAKRIKAFDWSQTPVGKLENWPQSLRNQANSLLATLFPSVLFWGPHFTVCAYNDAYRPLLGRKPEALGRSFLDIWQEARENIKPQIAQVLQGKACYFKDVPFTLFRCGEPDQAYFDCCFSPVRDENGSVKGVLNTAVESTDRRKDEMVLEKKNTDLRLAQRIAGIGTWTLDPEIGVPEWSEEIYRIYERDPNLGPYPLNEYKNIYKGKWFEKFHSAIQGAIVHGTFYDIELKLVCPSGKTKWIHAICEPEPERGPKGHKVRGTIQDITERKRAEEELRKKTRLLERMSENMFDMVSLSDLDGRYTFASRSHERILGYTTEELVGKNVLDFVHPDDLPRIAERVETLLKKGGIDKAEYRYKHKKNYYLWLETAGELLLDENKAPAEIIFSTRDITDQIEARQEFEKIFSMSLDMICIADINTATFLKVNPAFTETLGFSEEELLATPFTDFIHPEDIDSTISVIEKQLQAGEKVINFDNRYRCKDGTYLWLSWVSHPNPQKGITYAVARDITRLKQNQEKLKESNALLDTTGRMAKVGGWKLDAETLEVTWTDETYRIHELPVGHKPQLQEAINYFHPEDRPKLEKAIGRALDYGDPYDLEIRFITAKGNNLWTRTKCEPEMADGKVVKLKGTFQDITELKVAENRLIELKRQNQALLDHSPVCHKIVDLDFNLQYMSASGFKMLKFDDDAEVYGKPYPFAFFPSAFREEMIRNLKTVMKTGDATTMEALTRDVKGNDIWLESALIPVFDDNGKIEYLTVVSADTTSRKENEKEKERLERQLIQAQKIESLGSLAGGIAHDFNNILFPIVGLSEMMMEDFSEDSIEYQNAKEILTAGRRGSELVKQILAFSRQSEDRRMPVQFQSILKEVLKLCRSTIPADITIHQEIQGDCGFVNANPTRLHQIAMNLITNAFHAVEPDHGDISVRLSETEIGQGDIPAFSLDPGRYLMLTVSDTGSGIDPGVMDKIFDPYFTTKEKGKGTGLGLSVVHGIVREYGGDIKVYSEPGKGATFSVYIPLMEQGGDTGLEEKVEVDPAGNENILLVDDEEQIVRMERTVLERLGYHVTSFADSIGALELFRSTPGGFDLVITDMAMPNMTGDQLAREIMSIRPDIPIIICTGFSERINQEKADALGIKGFVKKPVIKSEMARMIRNVLDEGDHVPVQG